MVPVRKWLLGRASMFKKVPQYQLGQLVVANSEVHAVLDRTWSPSLKTWKYQVGDLGWYSQSWMQDYLRNYGDLGCL